MANEFLIGIKIGAALAGNFNAIFSSARTTALKLGQTATEIGNRHTRMGEMMARALSHPARNVGALRSQYERLGTTLDQLRYKQEKLMASMARGAALRNERSELRGQAMETIGTAVAIGAPAVKSVMVAASFQDQLRDTAITGEFSKDEEARIGSTIRKSALDWNQTQLEIGRGIGVLVAGGIQDAKALEGYTPVLAKAATATRAGMDDLGKVALALKDSLKVGENGFEGALNMLSYAGKRGQFEIKDMAKHLPTLAPMYAALGVTGKEAVAEIGAAFQIARKGAGSNDQAATNFVNFMTKLTSPDTKKDFERAGIDIEQSMNDLRAKGLTPTQAMLGVITDYMKTKGPGAVNQFTQAMQTKDEIERKASLDKLAGAYKLGELFQDMQAMSFIRPAVEHNAEMEDIKKGSLAAADKGLLDADFKKRMETATSQYERFKISISDIGITIGDALLPSLIGIYEEIRPSIQAFGEWAKQNPGIIRGAVGLVGGLLAGKLAFIGLKYGINLVLSPFNALGTTMKALSGRWTLLRAAWQAGSFAPMISSLRTVGGGLSSLSRFLGGGIVSGFSRARQLAALPGSGIASLGRVLGGGIVSGFRIAGQYSALFGRGLMMLGRLLGGGLLSGLRLAGQAVLWLGRAMLMNPIGIAVTVIAGAAYLIYRNWDKLKPWFIGLWNSAKTTFAGALTWFGNLTKKFTDFGGMLIDGLVGGIKNKIGAAKESIVNLGGSIKDWFTSTLGIKSPSRVFMGFGDNIAQGAAIGVARSSGIASRAAHSMATDTATAALQRINNARAAGAGIGAKTAGAGVMVHLTQTFNLGSGGKDVKGQMQQAAQMTMHELEQMMRRVMQQQERRSY